MTRILSASRVSFPKLSVISFSREKKEPDKTEYRQRYRKCCKSARSMSLAIILAFRVERRKIKRRFQRACKRSRSTQVPLSIVSTSLLSRRKYRVKDILTSLQKARRIVKNRGSIWPLVNPHGELIIFVSGLITAGRRYDTRLIPDKLSNSPSPSSVIVIIFFPFCYILLETNRRARFVGRC